MHVVLYPPITPGQGGYLRGGVLAIDSARIDAVLSASVAALCTALDRLVNATAGVNFRSASTNVLRPTDCSNITSSENLCR